MRFQVPQFIEVEDKIFGPLTIKQFIYLAGGVGIGFALYSTLPLFFAILIGVPILALSGALAFYKVNDRPFIQVLESAVYFALSNKLYIWEKRAKKAAEKEVSSAAPTSYVPKISDSKLKDLAWSLDIKENIGGNGKDPANI